MLIFKTLKQINPPTNQIEWADRWILKAYKTV